MYAFLRGLVAQKNLQSIALDVGGVGYEVLVPDTVHHRLSVNQEALLLTHCHIREDSFQIFGFLKEEERALFRLLLEISGVGPKVALSVVSAMPPAVFGQAVQGNDVTAFTKVSGVGKKLAQRILLEVKSKLGQHTELGAILGEPVAPGVAMAGDDAYEALLSLGCSPQEARRAVQGAREMLDKDAKDEDVVRAALRSLARK